LPAAAFGEVVVAAAAEVVGFVVAGAVVVGRLVAGTEDAALVADADAEPLAGTTAQTSYLKCEMDYYIIYETHCLRIAASGEPERL
jgi:hypothetical protein